MDVYEFGGYRLDTDQRKLSRDTGEIVTLTPRVFDLLLAFVESGGRTLTKDELLEKVWLDTVVEESNLSQGVFVLRKALNETAQNPKFIRTVPARGYRFIAPVTLISDSCDVEIKASSARISLQTPEEDPVIAIQANQDDRKQRLFRLQRFAFVSGSIASVFVVIALVGGFGWLRGRPSIESIVILPFANVTGDPQLEYIAEGIADGVGGRLARLERLKVFPRSVTAKYRNAQADPVAVGGEVGADSVLFGKVTRLGEMLEVHVELVETSTGQILWGENFRRHPTDLVGVHEGIFQNILQAVGTQLSKQDQELLSRAYTDNPAAFAHYQKGRHFCSRYTPVNVWLAVEEFNQALAADPAYAIAYAGLADCYSQMNNSDYAPPHELMPKARNAALKAIELDPFLSDGYVALGWIKFDYDWDWVGSERDFRKAIELNPNNARAHAMYSFLLRALGRFQESFSEILRAREIDPVTWQSSVGVAQYHFRDYRAASESFDKALALNPNNVNTHWWRARMFTLLRDDVNGIEAFRNATRIPENSGASNVPTGLRLSEIKLDEGVLSAQRQYAQIAISQRSDPYSSAHDIAISFSLIGDVEQAIQWLIKAYEERSSMMSFLAVEPAWDPIRSDPRFMRMVADMGLGRFEPSLSSASRTN